MYTRYYFTKVLNSMVPLCVTVVDVSHRKSLLPREIVPSHLDAGIIQEFLDSVLIPMLSGPSTSTEAPRVSRYIISRKC